MSDVPFVKRQSFLRWKWKKAFDGLDILVYIVYCIFILYLRQSNFWKCIDRWCMYGRIIFVNDFFFLLVYIALNTISTLTCLLLICWLYIHRITWSFLFMTFFSTCKVFYAYFRWFGYAESYLSQYFLLF